MTLWHAGLITYCFPAHIKANYCKSVPISAIKNDVGHISFLNSEYVLRTTIRPHYQLSRAGSNRRSPTSDIKILTEVPTRRNQRPAALS